MCIKNANCYNSCLAIKWLFLPESSLDESPISHGQKHGGGALLPVKNKRARKRCFLTRFSMPVVGVEPTRVISTRNFEFLSSSSIWCHPVISSDIWSPLRKGKIHVSTNNNLKYPRFFDAFSLYSVFSIWIAQMEIGGMFRRDAGPVIQDCAHRLFLENISNPCNSGGGSFVSRMKRQNRVHTPAATHNKKRGYILL